ncbi:hypothetical protein FOMPIDRAFT_1051147 [Fomitopsis schrenkii]|uniref:Uncharacterized protein n=1 Tax=Fomitopsis schrenkii TaxID=2126942 RepID=S8FBE5_FOMSC|nr:hypothetical protein FOMPIDRAFT_1051147 [Fomitopsis schrenkii]
MPRPEPSDHSEMLSLRLSYCQKPLQDDSEPPSPSPIQVPLPRAPDSLPALLEPPFDVPQRALHVLDDLFPAAVDHRVAAVVDRVEALGFCAFLLSSVIDGAVNGG